MDKNPFILVQYWGLNLKNFPQPRFLWGNKQKNSLGFVLKNKLSSGTVHFKNLDIKLKRSEKIISISLRWSEKMVCFSILKVGKSQKMKIKKAYQPCIVKPTKIAYKNSLCTTIAVLIIGHLWTNIFFDVLIQKRISVRISLQSACCGGDCGGPIFGCITWQFHWKSFSSFSRELEMSNVQSSLSPYLLRGYWMVRSLTLSDCACALCKKMNIVQ